MVADVIAAVASHRPRHGRSGPVSADESHGDVRARLEVRREGDHRAATRSSRSALLPLLHLVQSEEGYVSPDGIEFCAEVLGLTTAEVGRGRDVLHDVQAPAERRLPVGVCTNTLCAVHGRRRRSSPRSRSTSASATTRPPTDGKVTLEHLECNAACDYAPVMMVNWEFFDNQTPESAARARRRPARRRRRRRPPAAPSAVHVQEVSRVLAGFPDGRADEGAAAGPATLAGLRAAPAARRATPERRAGGRRQARAPPTAATSRRAADGPMHR